MKNDPQSTTVSQNPYNGLKMTKKNNSYNENKCPLHNNYTDNCHYHKIAFYEATEQHKSVKCERMQKLIK